MVELQGVFKSGRNRRGLNKYLEFILLIAVVFSILLYAPLNVSANTTGTSGRWIMGYYAGWQRDMYPVSEIDWSSLTHLAVAFYLPKNDGTLDETLFIDSANGPALARSIVAAAHQNNRKAIASIGGEGTRVQWLNAASSGTLATFVTNLKKIITDYGYDGLDLDWEPIQASDSTTVKSLVTALRTVLPTAIITMPVGYINVNIPEDLSLYSQLSGQLDQINIMTYGMAGAYSGWKSWHSSALYQQDSATPTSVDSTVKAYLNTGLPAAKLGVGVGFYGLCYTPPVNMPLQTLGASTIAAVDGSMTYAQIMTTYYSAQAYHYDSAAESPYLSFLTATGTPGCSYISYEDGQSLANKGAYVKAQGLGGAIVWTINQGYYNSQNPLLVALRNAILDANLLTIAPSSQSLTSTGGTINITVTDSSGTALWTAASSLSWVTITSGSSATGSGTVALSVAANTTGNPRTGNITIAGQTFTVTQSALNNCAATVSSSLVLHLPIVTYNGTNYWADLQFNSATSTFLLADAGVVSNVTPYSNCIASTLSSDFKLHIPELMFNNISYWADLQWKGSVFNIAGAGAN